MSRKQRTTENRDAKRLNSLERMLLRTDGKEHEIVEETLREVLPKEALKILGLKRGADSGAVLAADVSDSFSYSSFLNA